MVFSVLFPMEQPIFESPLILRPQVTIFIPKKILIESGNILLLQARVEKFPSTLYLPHLIGALIPKLLKLVQLAFFAVSPVDSEIPLEDYSPA
jgi:hypothetical protein